jgi:nicotinate-nucleotide adenylyltransferase
VRLGVFGGTFDPIHLGHLRAAETALEGLALDRVAFVPAGIPPHRAEPSSSALDRYAMTELATAGHPRFAVSDIELRRDGPSYTVDTVAGLRKESPDAEVFVIVGSDTFPEMSTWKEHERLLALCTVAVVARPGEAAPASRGRSDGEPPKGVARVEGPGLAISASEIRDRVRQRKSVRYLVPDAVADYITKRSLYR